MTYILITHKIINDFINSEDIGRQSPGEQPLSITTEISEVLGNQS